MPIGFIHLSDIHFGQEKGGDIITNNDIKDCLISDVKNNLNLFRSGKAAGIIITGDIAYSGQAKEYTQAALWLDKLTEAAGCEKTDIQLVPGNHDADWSQISRGTEIILNDIAENGETALDGFLDSELDCSMLLNRFKHYSPFAESYRCPLDVNASKNDERVVQLAPGKSIRFVRFNSALTSRGKDDFGKLLLGARQRVLTERHGEELIVLSHHPLNWFNDVKEIQPYIRYRARIFMTGHEHNPSCDREVVEEGRDLLKIAAGATVPPRYEDTKYCYNLIEFEWDELSNGLKVTKYPRVWEPGKVRFESPPGNAKFETILNCPNFQTSTQQEQAPSPVELMGQSTTVEIETSESHEKHDYMTENRPLLLLHFFRDISLAARIEILVDLGALPSSLEGTLQESVARRIVERLMDQGRYADIWELIQRKMKEG